jgi:hypothetical protein
MHPDRCQFANSAIKQAPRPFSAVQTPKFVQQVKPSETKVKELMGQTLIIEKMEKSLGQKIAPMTRATRMEAIKSVLGSRGVKRLINDFKDNDITYGLADKNAKHTDFSTYNSSMGYTIVPHARKAPAIK